MNMLIILNFKLENTVIVVMARSQNVFTIGESLVPLHIGESEEQKGIFQAYIKVSTCYFSTAGDVVL